MPCRAASIQRRRVLLLPRKAPLLHLPSRHRHSRTGAFCRSTTLLPHCRKCSKRIRLITWSVNKATYGKLLSEVTKYKHITPSILSERLTTMDSWEDEVRRFLLEQEEEDDELFLVMVPTLQLCLYDEKRPEHTSTLSGAEKVRQILEGHENWCKVEFRMEPEIFRIIANYLRVENLLRDTRGVRIEEQLGMFMFMLSHNASTDRIKKEFQHSGETVHRKITEFFDIILALTHRFLKLPNVNHTHVKIASDPRYMPFFQNYIGAIDGTHISITITPDKAPPYRNRKGTLSQNVMCACDFDLNFTFISCGWEGSASDAGVLRSARAKGFDVPVGKFYLVDGGYANKPSFIAPYRGVRYHLSEFRRSGSLRRIQYANYKGLFNHRPTQLRNHIERAFGVLKKRFPILKVGTFHPIENQIKIPAAAAVLHNIIRGQNGDEGWLDHQPDNINPANYVDLPEGDSNYPNEAESNSGSTLRDQIALQMWAAYNNN